MKARKKLVVAAVSLVAAASLTVGATFAWFSYQSHVDLGEVQFGVGSGDENLLVAVAEVGQSAGKFAYSVSTEDIKSIINKGNSGADITYQPLTIKDASGEVSGSDEISLVTQSGSPATGKEYATFDLVFRYTPAAGSTTDTYLVLNEGSIVNADPADATYTPSSPISAWWDSGQAEANKNKYGPELNPGDTIKARARDAARVAFVYGDTSKTNKIWAPSEDFESSIKTSDTRKGYYLENLAKDYATYLGSSQADYATPSYASRVFAADNSENDDTNSVIAKFTAPSGTTYSELRITVKVWLEGKDGDCLPSVVGDKFSFLLKFRTGTISD